MDQKALAAFDLAQKNNVKLAENTKDVIKARKRDVNLNSIKRSIPLVSFVDDDGNPAILTKLLPLSIAYNIPFTVCVPSDFIINKQSLSATQLLDLQNNNGFEIASHAKTHTPINDSMSVKQQFAEVYESWRAMREMGLDIETMVYPYGQSTSFAREIVSRFYKAGVSTDTIINNTPLRTYGLGRIDFPGTAPNNTLDYFKSQVDLAVANKSWLIFMLHCGQPVHDANAQTILEQLIQYIKSLNVDVVNVTDGVDISGNIIDINQQKYYYAKDGKNNIVNCVPMLVDSQTGKETLTSDTLPSQLENNKYYFGVVVSSTETAKMPYNGSGIITAIKGTDGYAVEHFYVGSRVFTRIATSNTVWGTWRRVLTSAGKQTANVSVTIPANGTAIGYITVSPADYTFNKMVVLNPQFTLNTGLMYSYSLDGTNGRIKINFKNDTATDIVLTSSVWQYVLMDF